MLWFVIFIGEICMMSAVFTYSLRFLVLFGLFFTSFAHAGIQFRISSNAGNATGGTAEAACRAYAALYQSYEGNATRYVSSNDIICKYAVTAVYTLGASPSERIFESPITSSCSLIPTTISNSPYFTTPINADGSVYFAGLPTTNQCAEKCRGNIDLAQTFDWFGANTTSCLLFVAGMPANTLPCKFAFIPNGNTCDLNDTPICLPPQILNSNNVCETPACPTGQVRETPNGECKPIVCTPPLVKVGNECKIPDCPSGMTYEYVNGVGQCVANDPICTPPATLVNKQCVIPQCPAGMIRDSSGTCIRDPASNPNTSGTGGAGGGTGGGTGGTGNTGGGTGNSGGAGGATGGVGSGGGGTAGGTDTGSGTGTGTSGGTGTGTSTNTGGDGLCTTPPCGDCDPTKQACGNTFGGSCKSGYQCNGDAIQCAVAQATNKAECLLKSLYVDPDDNLIYNEGKAAIDAGTKPLGAPEGGIPVVDGGSITLNRTNPYSNGCPPDLPLFDYKGRNYKLPLSDYCNIFQIMGSIMLLIAGFISMRILMKVD